MCKGIKLSIIYGLLGLGFIVFIHELGHFIAAKIFGVTVESFSVGMGPILLHKTIKGTDYRLSLIPLGGYCGMKGQKDFQVALDEKLDSIKGDKDSFYGIYPVKRAVIAFAGPFFNFLFAIFAFMIISMVGYSYYTSQNKIILANEIYPEMESVAAKAGLQTGDKIITQVNFNVKKGNSKEIEEKSLSFIKDRENKGHFKFPSAGSVFKNNRNFGKPSGKIIDEVGLRGFSVGQAQVAPWHGNFIINNGNATASDVRNLVEIIQEKVLKETGFMLECEIIFTDK